MTDNELTPDYIDSFIGIEIMGWSIVGKGLFMVETAPGASQLLGGFNPTGKLADIHTVIRLISTTNRPLHEAMKHSMTEKDPYKLSLALVEAYKALKDK